jgi:hypothetical protein
MREWCYAGMTRLLNPEEFFTGEVCKMLPPRFAEQGLGI